MKREAVILGNAQFPDWGTTIASLNSFNQPTVSIGGSRSAGCYTGSLYNWQRQDVLSTELTGLTDVPQKFKFLGELFSYRVTHPQVASLPGSKYLHSSDDLKVAMYKTSGLDKGPNDSSFSDHIGHVTSVDGFRLTSNTQAAGNLLDFPDYTMRKSDGYHSQVTGKFSVLRKSLSWTNPALCNEAITDLKDAYSVYSFYIGASSHRIGVFIRVEKCATATETTFRLFYVNKPSNVATASFVEQYSTSFTVASGAEKHFDFDFTFLKLPSSKFIEAKIQVRQLSLSVKTSVFSITESIDVTYPLAEFIHGVGNIGNEEPTKTIFHQLIISYDYLAIIVGGVPVSGKMEEGTCTSGISTPAEDACSEIVLNLKPNPTRLSKKSYPLSCSFEGDVLHSTACINKAPTPTISNCFSEVSEAGPSKRCLRCISGHFLQTLSSCQPCSDPNCHNCTTSNSCDVCKLYFVRRLVGGVHVCQSAAATGYVYVPQFQSEYPETPLQLISRSVSQLATSNSHDFVMLKMQTPSEIYLDITIEFDPDPLADAKFQDYIIKVAGKPVMINVPETPTTTQLKYFIVLYNRDFTAADYTVNIASRNGLVTFRVIQYKLSVRSKDFSQPCLITASSGKCLLCNYQLHYELNNSPEGCTQLAYATYLNHEQVFLGERQYYYYLCPNQVGVARCNPQDPQQVIECLPGYYLNSNLCLICSVMPFCVGCTSSTNCHTCSSDKHLQNTDRHSATVDSLCIDACPAGMFADASLQCKPCHPNCHTCSDPGETYVELTTAWHVRQTTCAVSALRATVSKLMHARSTPQQWLFRWTSKASFLSTLYTCSTRSDSSATSTSASIKRTTY